MRLSENFDLDEFDCHDGTPTPTVLAPYVQELATAVLQPIRTAWDAPIIVTSGYRTRTWNSKVGGARSSTHCEGRAADIRPVSIASVRALHEFVLGMYNRGDLPGLGGLGLYARWIHVDTRKRADGKLRRWSGKGVGSEPFDG